MQITNRVSQNGATIPQKGGCAVMDQWLGLGIFLLGAGIGALLNYIAMQRGTGELNR